MIKPPPHFPQPLQLPDLLPLNLHLVWNLEMLGNKTETQWLRCDLDYLYFVFKELETFCVSFWEITLAQEFQNPLCLLKSITQLPIKLTKMPSFT